MFIAATVIVTLILGAALGGVISYHNGYSPVMGLVGGALTIAGVVAISLALMIGTSAASDEVQTGSGDIVSGVFTHSIVSE